VRAGIVRGMYVWVGIDAVDVHDIRLVGATTAMCIYCIEHIYNDSLYQAL